MTDDGKSFDKIWDDGFAEVQKKNDAAKLAKEQKRASEQAEFERSVQWLTTHFIPLLDNAAKAGAKHGAELVRSDNFAEKKSFPEIKFKFRKGVISSTEIRVYAGSKSYSASGEIGGSTYMTEGFSDMEDRDGDPRQNLSVLIKNSIDDLMKKLSR